MQDYERQILEWAESDRQRIVATCADLVRFNTSSSHGDTRQAMAYIKDFLHHEHLPCEEFAACKTMPNLLSSTAMARPGRHLMLNGHLDTMPAGREMGWTVDPFGGVLRDDKIIDRGVSDMKAGVTAMLFAYLYARRLRDRLSGTLSLSLVSDEESGWGRGTGYLFRQVPHKMRADCVLSGEPSGVDAISFASKGYIQLTVKIGTRGAIAGYSNESSNAIEVAASIIHDLKNLGNTKVILPHSVQSLLNDPAYRPRHEAVRGVGHLEQLGRVTVDVCTIKGGVLSCVIAPDCRFTLALVVPWGTDTDSLLNQAKAVIGRYAGAELSIDGVDLPDMSPPDGEMVNILSEVVTDLGQPVPVPVPDIALSDCRYWRQQGIPAYWYGPGGDLCSAANEYVRVDDLLLTVKTHALAACRYLSSIA